jgi:hypothetical protein
MNSQAKTLRPLLTLKADICRELAPAQHLHATLNTIMVGGQRMAITEDTLTNAREVVATELGKIADRLEAGRRAASERQLEHQPAEALPEIVVEEELEVAAE